MQQVSALNRLKELLELFTPVVVCGQSGSQAKGARASIGFLDQALQGRELLEANFTTQLRSFHGHAMPLRSLFE